MPRRHVISLFCRFLLAFAAFLAAAFFALQLFGAAFLAFDFFAAAFWRHHPLLAQLFATAWLGQFLCIFSDVIDLQ